jgi:hypothetical protein
MPGDKTLAYLLQCELEALQESRVPLDERQSSSIAKLRKFIDEQKLFRSAEQMQEMEKQYANLRESIKKQEQDDWNEYIQELKVDAEAVLSMLAQGYSDTKNPLFLWRIYHICRVTGRPVPDVIWTYFDDCALNLHNAVHQYKLDEVISKKGSRSGEYAGEACLKALWMHQKNQINVFAGMKRYIARALLMADIEKIEKENLESGMEEKAARMDAIKSVHVIQEKARRTKPISMAVLYNYYMEYKTSKGS